MKNSTKNVVFAGGGLFVLSLVAYISYRLGKKSNKPKIKCNKEITVKITNDIDGSMCDVDVPINATIRDVIVGLIKEQFLKSNPKNYLAMQFSLYSLSGTKYDCLDRTIAEYGWHDGDNIIAAPLPYQYETSSNQDSFSDSIVQEIRVKIINELTGFECDIDVPIDADIYDIIIGLIMEQFLEPENDSCTGIWVLKDSDQGHEYVNRNKTVQEYGWQDGQTFVAFKKCNGITLTLENAETGQHISKTFDKKSTIHDIMNDLYKEGFLVQLPHCFAWVCKNNNSILGFFDTLGLKLNSGDKLLFCCEEYDPKREISIHVVKGFYGAECLVYVPMNATVGDVIVGLINEGFLDMDTPSSPIVLYNSDENNRVRYDDRSFTIREYGWQDDQTIIAVCEETCR